MPEVSFDDLIPKTKSPEEAGIDAEVARIMAGPHQNLPPSVRVADEFGRPVGAAPALDFTDLIPQKSTGATLNDPAPQSAQKAKLEDALGRPAVDGEVEKYAQDQQRIAELRAKDGRRTAMASKYGGAENATRLTRAEQRELDELVRSQPAPATIGPAPTVGSELKAGNLGNAAEILTEPIRRQLSGLIGPSESERSEGMVQFGTNPDGTPRYEYKPLGNRLEREAGLFTAATPPPHLDASPDDTLIGSTGKAAFNTVAPFIGFMTSPAGALLPGVARVPGISQAVSGAFAVDMASHIPHQLQQAALGGSTQEQLEGALGAGMSALFAGGAARHAVGTRGPAGRSRLLWKGDAPPEPLNAGNVPPPEEPGRIVAHHATPHEVMKFSTQNLGTGEGNLSFGRGLYVAESPAVSGVGGEYYKQFEQSHGKANSYQVEISAHPEDFIDIDRPLEEQSAKVKAAAAKLGERGITWDEIQHGAETARPALIEEGIAGARYKDKFSRVTAEDEESARLAVDAAQADANALPGNERLRAKLDAAKAEQDRIRNFRENPTRNYVIFDDAKIKITHKNGVPVEENVAPAPPPRAVPVELAADADAAGLKFTAKAIREEPAAAPKLEPAPAVDPFDEFFANEPTEPAAPAKEAPSTEGSVPPANEATGKATAGEVPTVGEEPALTPEQEAEWRAMQAEHEAEMRGALDEAPGSHELLGAVKRLGGLPSIEDDASLTGEVKRLWEASKGHMMRLVNAGQKLSLDGVREGLEQYGFKFDTAADMLDALENRITSGKEVRGFEPGGGDIFASKAEPAFEPRLRAAYDALVKKSRFGLPAVSIGELARESGIPLADLKAKLMELHKQGRVVLSIGDWSLSSPETRAGMMDVNGQRMTQVRPLDDLLTSKTPPTPESVFQQKLADAHGRAPTEAELDSQGKRPATVDFDRPGGAGRFTVQNTKEAIAALAKKQGVDLEQRKYTPAVKQADGTIFEAKPLDNGEFPHGHKDAEIKAFEAGHRDKGQRGFVDDKGNFLSLMDVVRAEAERRAQVRASLAVGERPAVRSKEVRAAAERAKEKLSSKGLDIAIIGDERELPADVVSRIDPRATHEGLVDTRTGRVFILADNIFSADRAAEVMAHEVVGHYGVEKLVGPKEWQRIADSVFRESPAAARDIASRYAKGKALNSLTAAERALVAREYVARLAEKPSLAPKTWERVVAAVRRALKALGIQKEWSEADIRDLLRRAAREVEAPREARGTGVFASVKDIGPDVHPRVSEYEASFEKRVPEDRREDVARYVADTLAGRETVELSGAEKEFADRSVRLFTRLKESADADGVGKQVMDAYRAALTAKPGMTLPERVATFTAETARAKRGAVAGATPPETQSAPVDTPPAPPKAPEGSMGNPMDRDSGETTALKRAVVDLQREVRGGKEIPVPTRVDSEELIRQAGEAVSGDPGMAARIVARILSTEHHDDLAVSRRDAAVMLVERTRLRNQRAEAMAVSTDPNALPEERAAAASDIALAAQEIDRLDQASRAAGTAWSDFGRLYQQVQRSDYTVEAQTRRLESAKGAPLDANEKATVEAAVSEIEKGEEAAKKRTQEIEAENSRQAAADYLAGLEPAPRASRAVLDLAEKIVRKLESAADAARKRIRERLGKTNALVDPTVIYDVAVIGLSKLGRASLDFARWSAEMVDEFDAMDFDVRPYLNEVWSKTQELWAAEEKKLTGAQRERVTKARVKRQDILSDRLGIYDGIKAAVKEGAALGGGLDKFVKQLVKNYVDAGERGLDNVTGKVKEALQSIIPDITDRQIHDAFSDYGKSTPATTKEADVHRAQIRREAQLTSAISDVESGVAPARTGKQRPGPSAAARQLTARLNEAKRRYDIQPADPVAALRSALDARKTYYRNRLQDLAFEIARKERVIREKSLSPTDAELDRLKAAYELAKADHEAVFGKPQLSDEQRLQQAIKIAERNEKIAAKQLEDAKKGIFPDTTGGSKPGIGGAPVLRAIRARAEAMRAETSDLKSQALGLDAARREQALQAKIDGLDAKLSSGDIAAAPAGARVEPSAKAEALKSEYDAMRGLLADLRRDADPSRAPDAVAARKLTKLQKEIDKLDAKMQAGDVSVRQRKPSSDSVAAEALKSERDAMRRHLAEMRRISNRTVMTPEERALKAYAARLAKTEADLADRNLRADAGDATAFTKKPRRAIDISSDPKLIAQKVRVEEAKTNLARKQAAYEKGQRTRMEKLLEGISGWRRAFVLSGLHTLAKLTSAAGEIVGFAPVEEGVGGAIGKLPLISRVAERAPRHGGFSGRAEVEAIYETTTKLFKDAGEYMKRGGTDLDLLYGQPHIHPFEYKELIGRMHGALKTPARRNEWTRSYRKRLEFAAKIGADITNPLVQTRIGLEAYEDANRSIFNENNMVVDAYKRALSRFSQKDKATGRPSVSGKVAETTARVILPVVRIPTNIVARTFEYTFGSVTGLAKLGFALARGIDTLPPEQADIIMRNLKRGSLGAAVLALGYLNPSNVGGYYNAASDEGEAKHGTLKIFGHEIPKILIHNPLLEQLQIGATVRRVADSKLHKHDKETQGIGTGLTAAALGVLKETPFLNTINRTGEAIRNSESFSSYAGDQVRGMLVPQGVDEAARFFDRDAKGETVKRAPRTLLERIQSSIPFYRNDLPKKKERKK